MERRYTMAEITAAMGVALERSLKEQSVERALFLFSDTTIQGLKDVERVRTGSDRARGAEPVMRKRARSGHS
jgi:hypothetical protein